MRPLRLPFASLALLLLVAAGSVDGAPGPGGGSNGDSGGSSGGSNSGGNKPGIGGPGAPGGGGAPGGRVPGSGVAGPPRDELLQLSADPSRAALPSVKPTASLPGERDLPGVPDFRDMDGGYLAAAQPAVTAAVTTAAAAAKATPAVTTVTSTTTAPTLLLPLSSPAVALRNNSPAPAAKTYVAPLPLTWQIVAHNVAATAGAAAASATTPTVTTASPFGGGTILLRPSQLRQLTVTVAVSRGSSPASKEDNAGACAQIVSTLSLTGPSPVFLISNGPGVTASPQLTGGGNDVRAALNTCDDKATLRYALQLGPYTAAQCGRYTLTAHTTLLPSGAVSASPSAARDSSFMLDVDVTGCPPPPVAAVKKPTSPAPKPSPAAAAPKPAAAAAKPKLL